VTRPLAERVATVRRLLAELRTDIPGGHERYLAIRDDYADRIWKEVDSFVTEAVRPRANTDAIKADLDTLLAHKRGDPLENAVFVTALPAGRFLIVALEIERARGAFPDDAFSIRVYRDAGAVYTPVTHIEIPEPTHRPRTLTVPSRPSGAEFWLFF
jgi:hypothetical protein